MWCVTSMESPTEASHWSTCCLYHTEDWWVSLSWSSNCLCVTTSCREWKCLMLPFFSFVCGAFRANTSLLHTHINTPFPSQFFVWLFLFCFCMSGFHHPSMMLLRLEKQGDARRKPERKRVFFGGYFSTLTWMYIYSLRVYLSLRWPIRIVFYTVCDNHWAHAILQCCWHDVKSTLDLTLPDVVARAAFVHHWAKNLALYCDVTLQITCSGLWSVIVYKLFLWYY